MVWILAPFYGAILWGIVVAIVFWPLNKRLIARFPGSPNLSASITLLAIIAIVIVPAILIGTLLIEQALSTYAELQAKPLNIGATLEAIRAGLPEWLRTYVDRFSMGNMAQIEQRVASILTDGVRLAASQAVSVGQGAFNFFIAISIMLYLSFYLLRDGRQITRTIGERVPLAEDLRRDLFGKFATVIRATIKGSIVVAIVQGTLGGIIFAFLGIDAPVLWGVVMGFLSLLPAIGTGLVWVPVAIYLFATGSYWQGGVLVFCGIFVIGMVDNALRPILVGKDTRMPDYVVLISTLGGISVMGINGFIIGPVIAALFIAAWDIFLMQRTAVRTPTDLSEPA